MQVEVITVEEFANLVGKNKVVSSLDLGTVIFVTLIDSEGKRFVCASTSDGRCALIK